MNNRFGIGRINFAKYTAGRILGDRKPMSQSLAGFSFLLDYVPNWQFAYLPGGLIQYQSFVPHGAAQEVFSRQIRMAQEAKLEPFLGVLKRHRPDPFLITWALDGFSFALDFKVSKHNWTALRELCWRMNDLVLDAGGRFYFAKDSTLRPEDVRRYLGESTLAEFRRLQAEHDPQRLLTSALAERVGLCAAS
jgi:decaprenylphospho-beta-D-ribofuranose 2-oxidase